MLQNSLPFFVVVFCLLLQQFVKVPALLQPVGGGGPVGPELSVERWRRRADRPGAVLKNALAKRLIDLMVCFLADRNVRK